MTTSRTSEQLAVRWYLVTPLPDGADTTEALPEQPGSWLLDTCTGQMVSLSGWQTSKKPAA